MIDLPENRLGSNMRFHLSKRRVASFAVAVLFVGALSACSPRIHTRGNLPDPDMVAELKAGDITKDEVAELLGSPSTIGSFGNEAWFYISERTETIAWFEPEVKERNVLVLEFDKEGVLVEKFKVGLDSANKVIPVDRRTLTHGSRLTVIKQIVGNFRRFSGGQ